MGGPACQPGDHGKRRQKPRQADPAALAKAADIFRALGDTQRLRLLELLAAGECCVTELVAALDEKFSTVSQRLRLLRTEGLVSRRRDGQHIYYSLADRHVADLIDNGLAHAAELTGVPVRRIRSRPGPKTRGVAIMSHGHHANHTHQHGANCGHTAIKHDGHVDYLHDGHLHHVGAAGVEEHHLDVNAANPAACTPSHDCGGHPKNHQHGPNCGHEAVPHGDHVDYLVNGHLHHPHAGHCDDHGKVAMA